MRCVPLLPAKLKELNGGAPQEQKLSEEVLESLEKLLLCVSDLSSAEQPTTLQISLLWKASQWPEGIGPNRITLYSS